MKWNSPVSSTQKAADDDVVVIGGSAAGLFTAYLLARGGRNVQLFDANDVRHTTPRTLITTARLTEVLGFFPRQAVVNEINEIELFSRERSVSIPMIPADLVVERSAIVRMLADKAIDAGVRIRGGCRFVDLRPADKGIEVTIQDSRGGGTETLKPAALIGADGTFSRVAKIANRNGHDTTPILQAIVNLPHGARKSTTQVWFEPADTPYFYWLIPESEKQAAVGLIADEGSKARSKLAQFLARRGMQAAEIQAARIPAYTHTTRPWRRISGTDIYLVGDAASQVKVSTVGGLVTGLQGARAAADAILQRRSYSVKLRPLRWELSLHLFIRTMLNRFRSADYDRLLALLNEETVRLLGLYNRDRAARMLCRIVLSQPRLLRFVTLISRRASSSGC